MVFNYHRIPLLPKLAWCAVVVHNAKVHATMGIGVETFTDSSLKEHGKEIFRG